MLIVHRKTKKMMKISIKLTKLDPKNMSPSPSTSLAACLMF